MNKIQKNSGKIEKNSGKFRIEQLNKKRTVELKQKIDFAYIDKQCVKKYKK